MYGEFRPADTTVGGEARWPVLLAPGSMPFEMGLLLAAHFLGDFAFQSAWMAAEKTKSNEVLVYHVCTYSAPFFALAAVPGMHITLEGFLLNAIAHAAIDYCKGHEIVVKTIWQDQLLHLATILTLFAIGWL